MTEVWPVKDRIRRELERAQREALNAERNIAYYSRLLDTYEKREEV